LTAGSGLARRFLHRYLELRRHAALASLLEIALLPGREYRNAVFFPQEGNDIQRSTRLPMPQKQDRVRLQKFSRVAAAALLTFSTSIDPILAQTSPADAPPAGNAPAADAKVFSLTDLEYLVGPIALYPDPLIALILPASTFPLQVVQADRWLSTNADAVKKNDFSGAEAQGWDSSVVALIRFPDVLHMMSDHLDWTQSLGSAFSQQPQDVANAVQSMRAQAQKVGNLQTTPQQVVTTRVESGAPVIFIEPAVPDRIYVPVYDPGVVFTSVVATGLIFGTGVLVGSAWNNRWGWNNRGWNTVWINQPVWVPGRPGGPPPGAWRPDRPGNRPDRPGVRPPGGRPDRPVRPGPDRPNLRPDRPGGVRPDRPGVRPDLPVRPDRPGVRPDRPGARPDRPAVRPDRPGARPDRPAVRPDRPNVRPDRPAARPDRPAARPDRPAARPDRPAARPNRPAARPNPPAARPNRPAARPNPPAARPNRPAARPSAPAQRPQARPGGGNRGGGGAGAARNRVRNNN
jgi:hypothetical protein